MYSWHLGGTDGAMGKKVKHFYRGTPDLFNMIIHFLKLGFF